MEQLRFEDLPNAVANLIQTCEELKQMLQVVINSTQKKTNIPEGYIDVEGARQMLQKKTKSAIYNMVHTGTIPCSKLGKSLIFSVEELQRHIASKRKLPNGQMMEDATEYIITKKIRKN